MGCAEGKAVGRSVGLLVGDSVGRGVGALLGRNVGMSGMMIGRRDGPDVGLLVGVSVGDAVGALLGLELVGGDARRNSVVTPITTCRASQLVNMWQNPVELSTSALHSYCNKQASTHSVIVRFPPCSLNTGARPLNLLHRSPGPSISKRLYPSDVGTLVGAFDGPALGALLVGAELGAVVGPAVGAAIVGATEHQPHVRAQLCRIQSVLHAASPGVKLLQACSSRSLHSVGAMVGGVVGLNDGPRLGHLVGTVVGEDDGRAVGGSEQRPQAIGQIAMAQSSPHKFSPANRGHRGMSTQDVGAELGAAPG